MSCCKSGKRNTGRPSPTTSQGVVYNHMLVPFKGSTGERNCIDVSDPGDFTEPGGKLPATFFEDKINAADQADRYFPFLAYKNTEPGKTDPTLQTFNDGSSVKIRDGVRTFTAFIPEVDAAYIGKLKAHLCDEFGVYIIDDCGVIWGDFDDVNKKLYPYAVERGSFDAFEVQPTDSQIQGIQVTFQMKRSVLDENSRAISTEYYDENLLEVEGLLDAIGSEVDPGTLSEFTVKIEQCYGSANALNPIKGLQAADFVLTNLTTPGVINITQVDEDPDGTYLITHDAVLTTEVRELTLAASLKGYEMDAVTSIAP